MQAKLQMGAYVQVFLIFCVISPICLLAVSLHVLHEQSRCDKIDEGACVCVCVCVFVCVCLCLCLCGRC